jgi:signal peptidase II
MPYLILSVLIIIGDQCCKKWVEANINIGEQRLLIPGLLRLTHKDNTGAAFSLLEGKRTLFLILTAIICGAIIILLLTGKINGKRESSAQQCCWAALSETQSTGL